MAFHLIVCHRDEHSDSTESCQPLGEEDDGRLSSEKHA